MVWGKVKNNEEKYKKDMFIKLTKEIRNINKKSIKRQRILFSVCGILSLFSLILCLSLNGSITEKIISCSIIVIGWSFPFWVINSLKVVKISKPVKLAKINGKNFYKSKVKIGDEEFEFLSNDDKDIVVI